MLEKNGIDYFNPVLPVWTEAAYERELIERELCDVCLYVITPKIHGYFSIAEVVDDSNKRPEKAVFCILDDDEQEFTAHELKSLRKIGKMVSDNGGSFCEGMSNLKKTLESKIFGVVAQ